MNRLTERIDGIVCSRERYEKHSPCHGCQWQSTDECKQDDCTYGSALDKLAAYEDTGLEPNEIKQSCTYPLTGCSDCNYTKLLPELSEARKQVAND